jgi:hypothetical protein
MANGFRSGPIEPIKDIDDRLIIQPEGDPLAYSPRAPSLVETLTCLVASRHTNPHTTRGSARRFGPRKSQSLGTETPSARLLQRVKSGQLALSARDRRGTDNQSHHPCVEPGTKRLIFTTRGAMKGFERCTLQKFLVALFLLSRA